MYKRKFDLIINIYRWVAYYKSEYTYNTGGNNWSIISYNWDEIANKWITAYITTYYYSEHNITFVPEIPEMHINVYPNPASDYIVFDISNISDSAIVEIFDNQGKKVLKQQLSVTGQIIISNLANGLYLYRLNDSGNTYTGRIIIEQQPRLCCSFGRRGQQPDFAAAYTGASGINYPVSLILQHFHRPCFGCLQNLITDGYEGYDK